MSPSTGDAMNADIDLIDEVLNEMAPLHKPTTQTPSTVMAIRNIIREALLKYDKKLRDERALEDHHDAAEN